MVGWLEKHFSECPRCGSPNIRVPWGIAAQRASRRRSWGLVALWLSYAIWATAAAVSEAMWLWLAPAIAYGAITLIALHRSGAEARERRCGDCANAWTVSKDVA